jgi:hypothetical protein
MTGKPVQGPDPDGTTRIYLYMTSHFLRDFIAF